MMHDSIFRKYDIRGKVGEELDLEEVPSLMQAIGWFFKHKYSSTRSIVVGMDVRIHSPAIASMTCAALLVQGFDVTFIGYCPSPVLYFSLYRGSYDAGIMITASHNTREYNGFKLCLNKQIVWGKDIQAIAHAYRHRVQKIGAKRTGLFNVIHNEMIHRYVHHLYDQFGHLYNKSFPLVIDCGNGTAGTVLPYLIEVMRWRDITLLCDSLDAINPKHQADPTQEKNMYHVRQFLANNELVASGMGLDGDSDRIAVMTKTGRLLSGDVMTAVFVKNIHKKRSLLHVVMDIKSSQMIVDSLRSTGVKVFLSPSGHPLIREAMSMCNATIGGEMSGHFFLQDRYFGYDDGIYALVRLMEIMFMTKTYTIETFIQDFPLTVDLGEVQLSCSGHIQDAIIAHVYSSFHKVQDVHLMTIDGVRIHVPYGWALVRKSNTQPVLTVRCEATTKNDFIFLSKLLIEAMCVMVDTTILEQRVADVLGRL